MPRLPDKEALGAPPEIASRPMASISATPAPDGVVAGAVAGAVEKIGDQRNAFEIEQKKKDDALDLIRAESYFKGTLRDTENQLRADPDHKTYQPRYISAADEARDKAAEMIKDPRTRALWRAKADVEREQGLSRVNNYGYHRASQEKEVEVERSLQGYQTQYANRDLDDAARAGILKDMDSTVRLGEASGLIMPHHAQKLRDKYVGGTVVDEYDRQIIDGKARDVLEKLGWKQAAAPGSARAAQEEPGLSPGSAGSDLTGVLTSGKAKAPAAGWAKSNETWASLNPFEKAAAMSLMEADGKDPNDARNALNAMINRAAKNGEDLGAHVSQKIYQPTIEQSQESRLESIVKSPQFRDMAAYAQARAAGKEADTVNGATHFLAHEQTMERLTDREPGKYRSWPGWSGYDRGGGKYTNPDGSEVVRDKSHAFLAPEGRLGAKGKTADGEVEYSDLPALAPETPQGRLTPHQRHALITRARNALRGDTLRSLSDAEQTIYDTGKMPTDENGKTPLDHAEGVLDPNQIEKARSRIKLATKVYEATTAVRDMSDVEADDHLAKFDPGQNPKIVEELGYADAKRVYDQGQKEKERTQKMREKDPAHAADQSREVADVLQRMQKRNPELQVGMGPDGNVKVLSADGQPVTTQDFHSELIRARLEAQDRYGIPEDKQKIINRSQAEEILPSRSFTTMKDRSFKDVIKTAADKAEALYGRKYSDRVMRDAISFAIKDKEHNEQATKIASRILLDGDVPNDEIEKYQALKSIRGFNDALEMGNRAGDMGRASNGGMNRPTRSGDPSRPAIDPTQMYNYSQLATGYAQEQIADGPGAERIPDKASVEWLKRNPGRAEEFDRQFGRFSAAKVLGNAK